MILPLRFTFTYTLKKYYKQGDVLIMKMVEIMLDKKRVLKFGVKAFVEIERATGKQMDKIDFNMQESIYALLLGGLIHQDKKLTLDKVMDLVDVAIEKRAEEKGIGFMEAFGEVLSELGEAIGEAMGNDVVKP